MRTVTVALRATTSEFEASMARSAAATRVLKEEMKGLGNEGTKTSTKASAAAAQEEQAARRRQAAMGEVGRASLLMGGALLAGFAMAEKATMDFDAAMSQVQALSHANAQSMGELRTAAMNYGNAIGFSAKQTADAEIELVKAGLSVTDILSGALKGALSLAAAGQIDVAKATEIAASAMTQFSLKGKDVPHIADLLAAGADKALGSVGDLGFGLSSAGTVAAQFGWSLEQTVGTLSEFAQNAQIGEKGGTLLRQMLLQLAAPSQQAQDLMTKYGLSIYDANGKMVDSATLAGRLQNSFSGLAPVTRNYALGVIFGSRAIQGANILMKDGAAVNAQWVSTVNDSGFAAKQAAAKMDNLKGDVSKLGAAFQKDLITGGSAATGALRGVAQGVTAAVTAYGELSPQTQGAVTAMVGISGAALLAGGAALVMIPKIAALDAALLTLTGGAVGARTALIGLSTTAGAVTGIGAIYIGANQLGQVLDQAGPKADALTKSLQILASTGKASGEFTKTFGTDLGKAGDALKQVADPSTWSKIEGFGNKLSPFGRAFDTAGLRHGKKDLEAFDTALTNLVRGGQANTAAVALGNLGLTTEQGAAYFPKYAAALDGAGVATEGVTRKTGDLTAKQEAAQAKTDALTKSLKDQADALTATFDPLFGMVKATQAQADAQKALTDTMNKHGHTAADVRDAQNQVLQTTIDLNGAILTLKQGMNAGTTSLEEAKARLDGFARQGLITTAQAKHFKDELAKGVLKADGLSRALDTLNGKHAKPTVTLKGVSAALAAVAQVREALASLPATAGTTLLIKPLLPSRSGIPKAMDPLATIKHATGGLLQGPGSGTSDSIPIRASNGEFVVRAAQTSKHLNLLRAINDGTRGFAAGGLVTSYNPRHGSVSSQAGTLARHGGTAEEVQALLDSYNTYLQRLAEVAQREDLMHTLRMARATAEKAKGADRAAALQAVAQAEKDIKTFDITRGQDAQRTAVDRLTASLQKQAQATADREALRRQVIDNKFSLGLVSAAAEEADLKKRMAAVTKYSDEWMSLYQQLQNVTNATRAQQLDTVTFVPTGIPTGVTTPVPYNGASAGGSSGGWKGAGTTVMPGAIIIQAPDAHTAAQETLHGLAWLGR